MQELLDKEAKSVVNSNQEVDYQNEENSNISNSSSQRRLSESVSTNLTAKFSESALTGLFGKSINSRSNNNGLSQMISTSQSHFTLEETQMLLQEIMKNGTVLFSNVPGMAKLKVDAWESMAELLHAKIPDARKRPGIQLKKKWENVQMKTRKKILMRQEGKNIDMDSVDTQVIQIIATFFARKSISLTKEFAKTIDNINNNNGNNTISLTTINCNTAKSTISNEANDSLDKQNQETKINDSLKRPFTLDNEDGAPSQKFRNGPIANEKTSDRNILDHSLLNNQMNFDLNSTQLLASLIKTSNHDQELMTTLMEQLRQEHKIRLQTLQFQEVYWQLSLEALTRKCQMHGISTDF